VLIEKKSGKMKRTPTNGGTLQLKPMNKAQSEKPAEEALRKSEERYHSLFQSMLEGFAYCRMIFDDNGRPIDFVYLDVNHAFSQLTGLKDVVGKRVTEVIPGIKEANPELFEIYGRVALTGKPEKFEIDLKSLAISLAVSVSSPAKGDFVAVFESITERKRLQEQINLLQKKEYNAILQTSVDGFWRVDASGRFLDVNDAYSRMSGYRRDELLKMRIQDVEAKKSVEEIAQQIRKLIAVGSDRFETRHRRKDGKLIDIDVSARYIESGGGQFLGFLRDITERKMIEKRLHQAERLAAIGETAAMVGHDLRNPLQGIAGAVHLLRRESLTAEERDEMLQLIQKNVEYSDAIVRDLSEYSAEIQLKLVETTLKSITGGAIQAVKVPEKVIVQDLSKDHPAFRVDLDKMRRVFINLIENAIDAMPQGGTLIISSKQSNGDVEIALSDTGSGMPENVIENLWEPLQTTKAKGLGLGLAICKRITDAHGGIISVKSKAGEGTTVTIRLPIKPEQRR
jgi:PAS domain S-box-containing protein